MKPKHFLLKELHVSIHFFFLIHASFGDSDITPSGNSSGSSLFLDIWFLNFCHKALHPESGLPDIVPGAFSFTLKRYFTRILCITLLCFVVIEVLDNRWCYKPTFERGWRVMRWWFKEVGEYLTLSTSHMPRKTRSLSKFQLFITVTVMFTELTGFSPDSWFLKNVVLVHVWSSCSPSDIFCILSTEVCVFYIEDRLQTQARYFGFSYLLSREVKDAHIS